MVKIKMINSEVPKGVFYAILVICCLTLIVSFYTLNQMNSVKSTLQPAGTSVNEFLGKLTAHEELSAYKNMAPVNIVQITNNNIADLQAQIQGLDTSYLGSYIIQYSDRMIIYDFEKDTITANLQMQTPQSQLPADFFEKLVKHAELQGVETEIPTGGVIDQASLTSLQEQFPDVYNNANAGDYLLRYSDRIIIYNYERNEVIGAFELG